MSLLNKSKTKLLKELTIQSRLEYARSAKNSDIEKNTIFKYYLNGNQFPLESKESCRWGKKNKFLKDKLNQSC